MLSHTSSHTPRTYSPSIAGCREWRTMSVCIGRYPAKGEKHRTSTKALSDRALHRILRQARLSSNERDATPFELLAAIGQ